MNLKNYEEKRVLTELEKEKIEFVLKVLIQDLYKLLIIYGLSWILNCELETFVIHISFLFLRQYALGYHFYGHINCLIWSVVAFPINAKFIFLEFSTELLNIILALILIIILIIGPIGTRKFPILNKNHLKYLKKKLIFASLLLYILNIFLIPDYLKPYVLIGAFIELLLLIKQKSKKNGGTNYYGH